MIWSDLLGCFAVCGVKKNYLSLSLLLACVFCSKIDFYFMSRELLETIERV